jgi:hypothetical protein
MQLRNHIEIPWYRAKDVSVSKDDIACILDQRRPYDLAQAYEDAPHVALMNLSCDQDWAKFVGRWGPLWMSEVERKQGQSRMRLDWSWAFQRLFKSYARLLDCFGRPGLEEGERLLDFLKASEEESRARGRESPANATVYFFAALQRELAALELCQIAPPLDPAALELYQGNFDEDFTLWLRHASRPSVRRVVAYVINHASFVATGCLVAEWEGVRPRITARLTLDSLEEALEWMLWNSYWMKNPLLFCQECQRAFRPESAHPRKYCSSECAHRATDRSWHRRKSAARKRRGE